MLVADNWRKTFCVPVPVLVVLSALWTAVPEDASCVRLAYVAAVVHANKAAIMLATV